jgi:hypothetical protein
VRLTDNYIRVHGRKLTCRQRLFVGVNIFFNSTAHMALRLPRHETHATWWVVLVEIIWSILHFFSLARYINVGGSCCVNALSYAPWFYYKFRSQTEVFTLLIGSFLWFWSPTLCCLRSLCLRYSSIGVIHRFVLLLEAIAVLNCSDQIVSIDKCLLH